LCNGIFLVYFRIKFKLISMIQRIQTVYLLVVCILSFVLFFTPVSVYKNAAKIDSNTAVSQKIIKYNLKGLSDISGEAEILLNRLIAIPVINLLVLILALTAIFLFKKRSLQMKICKLLIVLNCVLLGLFILFVEREISALTSNTSWSATYLIGTYLPIAGLFFLYLANSSIKKDDNLVRSADRLR
jgi:hypothetical protein